VRLLYGSQSAWRTFRSRMTDGADVRQLDRNLIALGYSADGTLLVGQHFDSATAAAIKEWQRARGVRETGVLPFGSVAFMPRAVSVASQLAVPGSPAQRGTPLLELSSTNLVVSVALDPSLRQLVHLGDRVQIQLPQGQLTTGRISHMGAETAAPTGQGASSTSGQGGAGSADASAAQSNGPSPAAVPLIVRLDRPRDARGLDQVPVEVQITDTVRRGVLAVPVEALLALAEGGYAVSVQRHGTQTLVPVTPGIFDGDLVEVRSARLRPGMRVEVPSS
jgi:peptidoglycan hydrolase-like protein with peptidoglycan-binding domain